MKNNIHYSKQNTANATRVILLFFCVGKSPIKKGKILTNLHVLFSIPIMEKSPINYSKNSEMKTVIFYCFKKVLIRHSSRKLYDVLSEEAPYFIAQFPMVRKVR